MYRLYIGEGLRGGAAYQRFGKSTHMHPDNLWSDEDILPTVDPALLAAIEDGFPHSHSHSSYIWNCTTATHAVCYTFTPCVSPFEPYNILHIAKNLGMRLAL